MRKHIAAIIASALALSVTHTVIAQHSHRAAPAIGRHGDSGAASEQEKMQKYTCPMHPEVITDHPGNCPKCGMKLVPMKEKKRSTSNVATRDAHRAVEAIDPNRQLPLSTITTPSHGSRRGRAQHEHEKNADGNALHHRSR